MAKIAEKTVQTTVDEMIREAGKLERIGGLLPLIRLCVRYSDERQSFNAIRFGQKYVDRVANPEDLVKFVSVQKVRRTGNRPRGGVGDRSEDEDEEEEVTFLPID